MNLSSLKASVLISSAIALGLAVLPASRVQAQDPTTPSEPSALGLDLKLNQQQRQAIGAIGEFALDQMEAMLANGLDPKKLDRAETQRKTENIQKIFSTLRLDSQQKAALQTILRTAREQIKRQVEQDR